MARLNNGSLPDDWRLTSLGECAEIIMGQSPTGDTYNTIGAGLPLLNGPAEFGRRVPTAVQWTTSPTRTTNTGDVLFCVRGNTTGRMNIADRPYCIGRGLAAIRGKAARAETCFVSFLLEHLQPRIYGVAVGGGSTFPNISRASLREFEVPTPPLCEQRKIAALLGLVERAIEQQERLLALTAELKKALLRQLFTEGLRSEKQKQTDIGPVPKSWHVVKLGSYADFKNGINFTSLQKGNVGIPTIDVLNMYGEGCSVSLERIYRVNKRVTEAHHLQHGDLLFVRSSLKMEGVGWTSLFHKTGEPVTFCGFIIRARLRDEAAFSSRFLTHFFRTELARSQLISGGARVAITNINQGLLRETLVPLPPIEEQKEIADAIDQVDRKIAIHNRKKTSLNNLFRTLLHQLMTAELRVHEIDVLDGLN